MRRSATAVLLWTVLVQAAGCARDARPVPLPEPDLSGVEAPVAQAVRAAQQRVRESPGSAEAWAALGDRYRAHLWMHEAAACYRRAAAQEPDEFRWPYLVGKSLLVDDPEAAAAAFERALELDDGYGVGHLLHARALVRVGRFEQARERFWRARELEPAVAGGALLGLAEIDLADSRFDDARRGLELAVTLDSEDGRIHLALARTYMALGEPDRAREHSALGRRRLRRERLPDPRGALHVEAVGSLALSNLGRRLAEEGRLAEAERYLLEALRINPALEVPHYALGTVLARQGRMKESAESLRRAVNLKPGHAEAHALLGHVLLAAGNAGDEGVDHLREATTLDPTNRETRLRLAEALAERRRVAESIAELEALVAQHPSFAAAQLRLGRLLAEAPDPTRHRAALARLRLAAELSNAELARRLERLRQAAATGLSPDAAYLRSTLQLRLVAADSHRALAELLARGGDEEAAARHRRRAAELGREDVDQSR